MLDNKLLNLFYLVIYVFKFVESIRYYYILSYKTYFQMLCRYSNETLVVFVV